VKLFLKRNVILSLVLIGWFVAICAGMRSILIYEGTAGTSGASPLEWPADSCIQRRQGMPALVLMIHPHCPCGRATMSELAQLMVEGQGRVDVFILFVKPDGFDEDWAKTDTWQSASLIPGVKVSIDDQGVEAQRFGSQTSGQAILYSADGHLLFSGGITAARGHAGDNEGREAILALITKGAVEERETPVFGCPLFKETENDKAKDSCDEIEKN
jgi:hypothetical protein